jgi:amino acid transporter
MNMQRIKHFFIGKPLDPFAKGVRQHMALIAFFAWIGLGADGISSSAYGPEEAFVALGVHKELGVFLALATGFTVFLIAFAYMQVIELFPNGGGGYRVASTLLGARAGLVAGSALIIDYVLTIAISLASAVDSFFSVLPLSWQPYKLLTEIALVLVLMQMNLRGIKESIKILMPVFLGFIISYVGLIGYGVLAHFDGLGDIIPNAVQDSQEMASEVGWFAVLALFLKAFSMGGGTYTGLEAVSNSMNSLAEPRIRTGKLTMLCIAFSLAFMAMGIIMLYLLWDVERVVGETMNATAFSKITADWTVGGVNISDPLVMVVMLLTAGLLFVAGNTGFIAGPAVLANMAVDRWMPHMFSSLSSRLVTKNGVLLMGIAAIAALIITGGVVHVLVVLYSINVFLTFTLSLAGIVRYRWQNRNQFQKIIVPFVALIVCVGILITTVLEKFMTGGWMTIFLTGMLIYIGLTVKRHYILVQQQIESNEKEIAEMLHKACPKHHNSEKLDGEKPTAVFFTSETTATGLYSLLWVTRRFPDMFHNFIFVSVGEIDTEEFVDKQKWNNLRRDTKKTLKGYVDFCNEYGMPSTYYHAYGTDVVQQLTDLTVKVSEKFPNSIFFATKFLADDDDFITQMLHNHTAYIMQRRLHNMGKAMIIIPVKNKKKTLPKEKKISAS